MWFPQSWQWEHVKCWSPLGGLPSPVLNDLLPHPQPGRGNGSPSVGESTSQEDLFTAPNPSPRVSPPALEAARPPVPPGPDIDTNKAGLTVVHSYI